MGSMEEEWCVEGRGKRFIRGGKGQKKDHILTLRCSLNPRPMSNLELLAHTVEPPNRGHFGTAAFVLSSEVVLFSEVV